MARKSSQAPTAPPGALEADLVHLRPGPRAFIAQRRAQGMTLREKVFELHVSQARPLLEVARMLGVKVHLVSYHWQQLQKQILANAPSSPDDFAVLRERIGAMLWRTIAQTCPEEEALPFTLNADGEVGPGAEVAVKGAVTTAVPVPMTAPQVMAIRLKALEQLARLYDLGLDSGARADPTALPYATPEEIAAAARERVMDLHE